MLGNPPSDFQRKLIPFSCKQQIDLPFDRHGILWPRRQSDISALCDCDRICRERGRPGNPLCSCHLLRRCRHLPRTEPKPQTCRLWRCRSRSSLAGEVPAHCRHSRNRHVRSGTLALEHTRWRMAHFCAAGTTKNIQRIAPSKKQETDRTNTIGVRNPIHPPSTLA